MARNLIRLVCDLLVLNFVVLKTTRLATFEFCGFEDHLARWV